MARLYRAWSVIDECMGQDQVKFSWFVVGRTIPVFPYDELIENYDENQDEVSYDQMWVNEFFTEDEAAELREYLLNSHDIALQVEEVSLPVRSGGLSYGLLLISGQSSFYTLADEQGYNLSVSVLGHYNLQAEQTSHLLSAEDQQMGSEFLERVLTHLNISEVNRSELINILNKIYAETGLCVQQCRNN